MAFYSLSSQFLKYFFDFMLNVSNLDQQSRQIFKNKLNTDDSFILLTFKL